MKRFGESFRARRVALVLLSLLLAATQGHRIGVAQGARPPAVGAGASVTLLPDGRELIIGGVDTSGASASVWIRDPRTNAVAEVGRLSRARAWHSATMLPDGRVLIVGGLGNSGKPVQTVERFDIGEQRSEPLSVQWTGRYGHTATLLDARTLLLAGGKGEDGSSSADADILNLQTGVVTSLQPMSTPRANQTASLLADGRVELWGGQDANAQSGSRGAIFDPSSHTFTDSFVQEVESELPSVVTVDPEDRRDGVELQPQLTLRLSRLAQGVSLTPQTISLSSPDGPVAVRIVPAEGGRLAFVTPLAPLQAGTTYSLTTAGVIDRSGRAFPAFQMSFTTIGDQAQGAASADDEVFDPSKNDAWRRWRINRPESPWQHLPALMGPAGVTALSGQALKLNGTPLANVTMRLDGQTVVTDNSGRFLLLDKNLAIGWHTLIIEGRTAGGQGATYGRFDVAVRITPGKTNVLPYTIWMPKIDTQHAVKIASPTTAETVITTPYIPGLELRLPVGTVITDDDGRVVREVSITPIPVDRPPFPLPVGSDVPIYFTIQPGGAYVAVTGTGAHIGARLIYPNYRDLATGTKVDFWHYQPQAGKGWHAYGTGAVSADGRQVVPDPGTRLYTFTGAMFLNPGIIPALWRRLGNSPAGRCCDPVDLGTGLFF